MTTDIKLAEDDARGAARHADISTKIEGDVNSAIAERAAQTTPGAAAAIDDVAGTLRDHAVASTVDREHEMRRARGAARLSQFVDYGFYVVYALLGVRLALGLIAASSSAGFVRFIGVLTAPLYAPFRGITRSPATADGNTLLTPIIVALVVYLLLHAAVNGILRLFAHRKTAI